MLGQITERITPSVLAFVTFLSGVVLLFSGATPAATGRLELLDAFLPLGVIEVSHFLGSGRGRALDPVAGPGQTARCGALPGVDRDGGRHGHVAAERVRLRGGDASRGARGALAGAPRVRSPGGVLRHAILRGLDRRVGRRLGASVWLGFFAFKHVDYCTSSGGSSSCEERRHGSSAPRSAPRWRCCCLRSRGWSAMRRTTLRCQPMPISTMRAGDRRQPATVPFLVYLRDKAILFNDRRTAFVMDSSGPGWRLETRSDLNLSCPAWCVSRAVRRFRRRARLL